MLNIVVNYIQKKQAVFLAQSAIYLRHTRSVVKIVFQFKFFLNFVVFFKGKLKKWFETETGICRSRIQHLEYGIPRVESRI